VDWNLVWVLTSEPSLEHLESPDWITTTNIRIHKVIVVSRVLLVKLLLYARKRAETIQDKDTKPLPDLLDSEVIGEIMVGCLRRGSLSCGLFVSRDSK
jgi:hypothetical protein